MVDKRIFVFHSLPFLAVFTKTLQGRAWAIDGSTLANVRGLGAANDNTVRALQVQVRREAGKAGNPSKPCVWRIFHEQIGLLQEARNLRPVNVALVKNSLSDRS